MLRAVFLGLLAVSATSSCSRSEPAKVAPGAVAGRVIEVSGKVAASRDGKVRDLTVGAEVFGDDLVETSADGSVVIVLSHNNARWSVEGGQRTRVDASAAWKLAKQDAAKSVDHATSAAGRDGERTAAETRSTSESPDGAANGGGVSAGAPAMPSPAITTRQQRDRIAPKAEKPKAEKQSRGDYSADTEHAPSAGKPPAAEKVPAVESGAPAGAGKGATKSAPPPPPPPPPAPIAPRASDPSDEPSLHHVLASHRAKLAKCLDAKTPKRTLVVKIAKGKRTVELGGAADELVFKCIDLVVRAMEFEGTDASATIELTR